MSLTGKLVSQIEIKSQKDVFHDICAPHHISSKIPHKIQGCDLDAGAWGTVGSVISWNYTLDHGKANVSKETIEALDKEEKIVKYKVLEGDVMKLYKTFHITVHVDTKGESNLVTWTFDYEKLNANVPDPNAEMDYCLKITKDIETHHNRE